MIDERMTLFGSLTNEELKPWQGGPKPEALARVTDPDTSKDAAKTLSGKAGTMRRRLLRQFDIHEATAEEAAVYAGYGPGDGAWKRVSDLLNANLIEPTGYTRAAESGRQQRVLRITDLGIEALR